jgi:hypothetical protein
MIPMHNTNGFLDILSEREKERIVNEGNISYFQDDYDGITTLWNNNTIMLIIPKRVEDEYADNPYSYNDYQVEELPVYTEEAVDAVEESIEIEAEVAQEAIAEVVEEAYQIEENYYDSDAYKKEQEAREKRRLEREAKRQEARNKLALRTLKRGKALLNGTAASKNILGNSAYKKAIGNGKDEAVIWVNDFAKIYKEALPNMMYGMANPYAFMNVDKLYSDMTFTGKLNFEEDQVSMKYQYTMNDELAKMYKPIYNGKFNKNFQKYMNEDELLGYVSFNLSTEGSLKAYPDLIDSILMTGSGDAETELISKAAEIGSRMFSLLIDEKGAAKIVRGDMLFLITDLREREVTYTDYEYDEDYNYKEIEKTKVETIPDFLFMFSSEEQKLFHNIMSIAMKEGGVKNNNGIYQALSNSTDFPMNLYFMFKDNTVFLGTSVEYMTQIKNGTYISNVSGATKKNMQNSITSMQIKGGRILSEMPVSSFPRDVRNNIDFISNSTGDLELTMSKMRGNTINGEMTMETPNSESDNSLSHFIAMIDKLMK